MSKQPSPKADALRAMREAKYDVGFRRVRSPTTIIMPAEHYKELRHPGSTKKKIPTLKSGKGRRKLRR